MAICLVDDHSGGSTAAVGALVGVQGMTWGFAKLQCEFVLTAGSAGWLGAAHTMGWDVTFTHKLHEVGQYVSGSYGFTDRCLSCRACYVWVHKAGHKCHHHRFHVGCFVHPSFRHCVMGPCVTFQPTLVLVMCCAMLGCK